MGLYPTLGSNPSLSANPHKTPTNQGYIEHSPILPRVQTYIKTYATGANLPLPFKVVKLCLEGPEGIWAVRLCGRVFRLALGPTGACLRGSAGLLARPVNGWRRCCRANKQKRDSSALRVCQPGQPMVRLPPDGLALQVANFRGWLAALPCMKT